MKLKAKEWRFGILGVAIGKILNTHISIKDDYALVPLRKAIKPIEEEYNEREKLVREACDKELPELKDSEAGPKIDRERERVKFLSEKFNEMYDEDIEIKLDKPCVVSMEKLQKAMDREEAHPSRDRQGQEIDRLLTANELGALEGLVEIEEAKK